MSKQRLHPISAVYLSLKNLKELIVPILIGFFAGNTGGPPGIFGIVVNYIWLAIFIYILISGIIQWKRFVYWVEEDELRIEHGLFVKKKRYIPVERIQSLDETEGLLHRSFGLVLVKVETASSGGAIANKAEAELTAITREQAKQLKKELMRRKEKIEEESEVEVEVEVPKPKPFFVMNPQELFIMASTSGGIGIVIATVFAFLSQFEELIPYEVVYERIGGIIQSATLLISILVLFGLFSAWAASVVITMFRYANYRVTQVDRDLIIESGLLEKKQWTIPMDRIQAIRMVKSPIRAPFGFVTVILESAGNVKMDSLMPGFALFPIVKEKQAVELVRHLFPQVSLDTQVQSLPKEVRIRYIIRMVLLTLIPIIVAVSILQWQGLWTLILVPFAVFLGFKQYESAGSYIGEGDIIVRFRGVQEHTLWTIRKRVQSMKVVQSIFQKRADVTHLQLFVKSGMAASRGVVRDLSSDRAKEMLEWYVPKK
ncbi:PH domain-containing protein [Mangrovibacillus cuniculi]|uniref:PH domain-containing protein n=1 Tax=Mangrovibacillus cuniculi TaxID=2593652 RepID=A0A7S8CDV7_9BACI|nr:PH domain-containing protein [Mangrovibacillus cuniculi]QPC48182.1 PH domain-containing protein [Mangrovibacillus cuniculi]